METKDFIYFLFILYIGGIQSIGASAYVAHKTNSF